MEMTEDTTSQRRVIIGAIVLAVIVAIVLWYVLVAAPATRRAATEPTPSPSPLAVIPPIENDTEPEEEAPTPGIAAIDQSAAPTPSPTAKPHDIAPTSQTGTGEWLMVMSTLSIVFGAYKLNKQFS